jgi:cell division protein FtsL
MSHDLLILLMGIVLGAAVVNPLARWLREMVPEQREHQQHQQWDEDMTELPTQQRTLDQQAEDGNAEWIVPNEHNNG